jgi:hypothetical protein
LFLTLFIVAGGIVTAAAAWVMETAWPLPVPGRAFVVFVTCAFWLVAVYRLAFLVVTDVLEFGN